MAGRQPADFLSLPAPADLRAGVHGAGRTVLGGDVGVFCLGCEYVGRWDGARTEHVTGE